MEKIRANVYFEGLKLRCEYRKLDENFRPICTYWIAEICPCTVENCYFARRAAEKE